MLITCRNLHYRHKVFQVAHESRDFTQSIWIIFSVLFYFHWWSKRGKVKSSCIALLWFMYAYQVWLNNLTVVTLLTINSFPYKYGLHAFNELIRDNSALLCSSVLIKSAGDLDVFLYPIIIPNFFSLPPVRRGEKVIICANKL